MITPLALALLITVPIGDDEYDWEIKRDRYVCFSKQAQPLARMIVLARFGIRGSGGLI